MSWQDPFNPTTASGGMSLAPDNEFHQLSLTGGYSLPYKSRFTGLVSLGRMTQNQDFEPYTINTALMTNPLPRSSLDGEVKLTTVQLKLTSHPITELRLNADVRYNDRQNQTPVDVYSYVVLDSHSGGSIQNRPYSFTNTRINLGANYRFNAITSLRGGYKYNDMDRDYINAERDNTQENTLFAKWKIKPLSSIDVALYAETSSRDGSEYNTLSNENPALRKFNLANRERTKLGAKIDYMVTDKLFLSATADYNEDDYKNSTIGLTKASQPAYTFDFSYQPRNNITTYGYYAYE
ncbi:MAG: MtrB/PioB family decaheme-associated outer membrane protein, partial [Gammaproteobacteria bacterium]|nr:MtrB/PioB family decaheme-associated outer membrane protein [Gammaproteobacteria bacterium]